MGVLVVNHVAKAADRSDRDELEKVGQQEKEKGRYDSWKCFFLIPENDLKANSEELQDAHVLTFEMLREALQDDEYAVAILTELIRRRAQAFSIRMNRQILKFLDRYCRYVKDVYPDLPVKRIYERMNFQPDEMKFTTKIPEISIRHKLSDGLVYILLKLGQLPYETYEKRLTPYLFEGLRIRKKRRDALVYYEVPTIDYKAGFEEQQESLNKALDAVVELQEFVKEMSYGRGAKILMRDP